jgi:anthranilate synthase component 2
MSPSNVLLIDNYDSFTYNLYQYLSELGADVTVRRNDAISIDEARELDADFIVISPGPGVPRSAGISIDLIRALGPTVPILGVCLGHQAIAEAFGGTVVRAPELMHGKASDIHHDGSGVCAAPESVPDCLEVTARTKSGVIMAVRHRAYPVHGVQFHPESILTEHGKDLLLNFLHMSSRHEQVAA